jgi:hypothetical protein
VWPIVSEREESGSANCVGDTSRSKTAPLANRQQFLRVSTVAFCARLYWTPLARVQHHVKHSDEPRNSRRHHFCHFMADVTSSSSRSKLCDPIGADTLLRALCPISSASPQK